jgi:hypothetical protein
MVGLARSEARSSYILPDRLKLNRRFDSFKLIHWTSTQPIQVRLNNLDQLLHALGTGAPFTIRIDNRHDFGHRAVHRAACSDDEMKDVGAGPFFLRLA